MIEGGCLCGAIRYRAEGKTTIQAVCHCRNCQRQAGTAFSVILGVPADSLTVEGDPKVYVDHGDSGGAVNRHFCGACGSPLYSELSASPETVFLKAGTLDDTSILSPKVHLWCASAWPWTTIPEDAVILPHGPPR
jgi:hypothetical protein